MILKKITSTLITVLISVSFSAYTESDFHTPKCTFNNLVLNDAAKQNYTDQNSDDNSSVKTNDESNLKDEDNCYPGNCLFIDPDVDLDSDDWCELVCFDSPVSFIFRSSLLDNFDLATYDENKSTNINNSIPPAQKTCSEASNNINSTLEPNDENAIQSNYANDDLDDSIFAGMLTDVRNLRLEDICEFNSQITIPNQDDYIHNYSKEDLLANITLADVCEYISFDDPRSIVFAILPDETFINITDEDIKILEEKAIKLKEASITK